MSLDWDRFPSVERYEFVNSYEFPSRPPQRWHVARRRIRARRLRLTQTRRQDYLWRQQEIWLRIALLPNFRMQPYGCLPVRGELPMRSKWHQLRLQRVPCAG